MKAAIGYVRVSTDKQADKGISLDARADNIRAMATQHDHQLLDILVDDGESAKSLKRPAMAKLLTMIDGGQVKTVIVAKLDRLTRSVRDFCEPLERFERSGVALSAEAARASQPGRLPWIAAAGVLAVALGIALWAPWRSERPVGRPLMRLDVNLGPDAIPGANSSVVISPDGTRIIFPIRGTDGKQLLATRLLDQAAITPLPGTENGV